MKLKILDLDIFVIFIFSILAAPYTKVEESFNLQATHDLMIYGPRHLLHYDHFEFPGVVPRTFTGPVFLWLTSLPVLLILKTLNFLFSVQVPKVMLLLLTRLLVAFYTAITLKYLQEQIHLVWGQKVAYWFKRMMLFQFHYFFWGSRTLPNIFALWCLQLGLGLWIRGSFGKNSAMHSLGALATFVFTAVVFRSEISIFGFCFILMDLVYKRYSMSQAFKTFLSSFLFSFLWTFALDSWFWQTWIWPELSVFLFNTLHNGSIHYGTSPWHTYFTTFLPKLIPLAYPIALIAFFKNKKHSVRILTPVFLYLCIYSLLPHKEWRFIMYVIPSFILVSSLWISSWSMKSLFYLKLAGYMIMLLSCAGLVISSMNYPGGVALQRIHAYKDGNSMNIYMDVYPCMTGASRFLQECPSLYNTTQCNIQYDKNETQTTFDHYTHIITNDATKYPAFELLETVYGYDGIGFHDQSFLNGCMHQLISILQGKFSYFSLPIKLAPKVFLLARKGQHVKMIDM